MICPFEKIITVPDVTTMSSNLIPRVENVECSRSSCKHYATRYLRHVWVKNPLSGNESDYVPMYEAFCALTGDAL